jgi:hypothetical protein
MKLLILFCGGTLVMEHDRHGVLTVPPRKRAIENLLEIEPKLQEIAEIDVEYIDNIDSTNIRPDHWDRMARIIEENYEQYDGFIITLVPGSPPNMLSELLDSGIKGLILRGRPRLVIFFQSAANGIWYGGKQDQWEPAKRFAEAYAAASGYNLPEGTERPVSYEITGSASGYLYSQGIPTLVIEMATHSDIELERNLQGLRAVFDLQYLIISLCPAVEAAIFTASIRQIINLHAEIFSTF